MQIYDPATNTWPGADMPFAAGSSASAVIGGKVYVAGGIVGGDRPPTQAARYDPATNTWTIAGADAAGRNHAAAATDGSKLYVFGGRGPGSGDGNTVANGFDTVQVYDPATNTWASSLDAGSTLAPLPQARGGMGKAVYFGGEFYVIGGETLDRRRRDGEQRLQPRRHLQPRDQHLAAGRADADRAARHLPGGDRRPHLCRRRRHPGRTVWFGRAGDIQPGLGATPRARAKEVRPAA